MTFLRRVITLALVGNCLLAPVLLSAHVLTMGSSANPGDTLTKPRFVKSIRDENRRLHRIEIWADDEKVYVNRDANMGGDVGDYMTSGSYRRALVRNGRIAGNPLWAQDDIPNTGGFNLQRKQVYVLRGTSKGDPDILMVEFQVGSAGRVGRAFAVIEHQLCALPFIVPGEKPEPVFGWSTNTFHRIGRRTYTSSDRDPHRKWYLLRHRTWRLELKQGRLVQSKVKQS